MIDQSTEHHNEHVYLDYNATTPVSEIVRKHVMESLENWGNPSSIHWYGRGPKNLLRDSRARVGHMIGAESPLEVVFTSGGSESNSLAVVGTFEAMTRNQNPRNIYIRSAVEHPSVIKAFNSIEEKGAVVKVIPVSRTGEIDLVRYRELLTPEVALVSVMFANNETGAIFPIKKMSKLAHDEGALFHTDSVQGLGKVPLKVEHLGVDLASFSAHKFYALKGCGVLYVKRGTILEPQIYGGGQERGRRGGTENLMGIVSLAITDGLLKHSDEYCGKVLSLRIYLEEKVLKDIPNVEVIAKDAKRLPNTSCFILDRVSGETLLMNLDLKGFSVSTGSACSSGNPEPSAALLAMGIKHSEAQSTLRVSLGWLTSKSEIDRFVKTLAQVVTRLRQIDDEAMAEYGI
ncbi:MAG: cysteine desulfurase family protein [Pseudomonadota bacterium]|nr:cysteine desulfurase family protein [Pseudomonadota bacterium]